ncbi:DUF4177 domain-containing protein [Shewanella avicenniae]|uniref:DUF4177 domain-containing protein n=1 Tax=Shewanella avicenniae TaxID=2814294 RepID=A0ABX7QND2_9GAMM|nr:DUF4177 domain-containing protein [Shewanella avicenniae]
MQRVVEFKRRNFWSGRIHVAALNEQIAQYNAEGWRVVSVEPVPIPFGTVGSYLLLLENAH